MFLSNSISSHLLNFTHCSWHTVTHCLASALAHNQLRAETEIASPAWKVEAVSRSLYLAQLLGCTPSTALSLMRKNKALLKVNDRRLRGNAAFLIKHFTVKDIMAYPKVLSLPMSHVEHRHRALQEIGIGKVTVGKILGFKYIMEKSPIVLHRQKVIPKSTDIASNMLSYLDCPPKVKSDIRQKVLCHPQLASSTLSIKRLILVEYLSWRLKCSSEVAAKTMERCRMLQTRSLAILVQTLKILMEKYGFMPSQILENYFLMATQPNNLEAILNLLAKFGETEVKSAAHRHPRILQASVETLVLSLQFGSMRYEVTSFPTKGVDYLAQLFGKTTVEVGQQLRKHPKLHRASLANVRNIVRYLRWNGVSLEQLWNGLPVVLYNKDFLEQNFEMLPEQDRAQPFSEWKSSPYLLQLLLYFMETDSQFSGSGIYEKTLQEITT